MLEISLGAHTVMQNIDRFFDTYDRFLPSWFSDFAVAALIVIPLFWLMA